MTQYIDKSALSAEIDKRKNLCEKIVLDLRTEENKDYYQGKAEAYKETLDLLDTLEVKEVVDCKQPEYSYFKTTYQCGKKPRWNIGDTLAYYEFYTDREGEHVLGKVTKVDFDKEQCDWFYTLEGGSVYDEQSLLENETYKKN